MGVNSLVSSSKTLRFFLVFLFIFSLNFYLFPINSSRLVIIFILFFGVLWKSDPLRLTIDNQFIIIFIPLLFSFLYNVLIGFMDGVIDISNFANLVIIVFQIAFGAYLINFILFDEKIDINYLLYVIFLIISLQSLFIVLSFILPAFRSIVDVIIPNSGNLSAEAGGQGLFRVRGIANSTGASLSSFLSIGLLIGTYFLAILKRKKTLIYLGLILIPAGIAFTGRTGLFMIPTAVLFYYSILAFEKRLSIKSFLPILITPILLILFYIFFKQIYYLITGGGIPLPTGEDLLSRWERWAFGDFINLFSNNEKKLHTLKVLDAHLFFPEDNKTWLLGNPRTWTVDRISSDIGYVRVLFSQGLIGGFLFYFGFALIYGYCVLKSNKLSLKLFFLFFAVWMFIIEYKEPFINHYYFTSFTFLCAFAVMKDSLRAKNENITGY
ncbi:MAG: hypothetical protein ACXIUQ_12010 [Cecembia sp.]